MPWPRLFIPFKRFRMHGFTRYGDTARTRKTQEGSEGRAVGEKRERERVWNGGYEEGEKKVAKKGGGARGAGGEAMDPKGKGF